MKYTRDSNGVWASYVNAGNTDSDVAVSPEVIDSVVCEWNWAVKMLM